MRIKILGLGLTLLLMISCAFQQQGKRLESISQDTKFYANNLFEDIWTASMRAIEDLGFMIREEIKDRGLLDAVGKNTPSPGLSPPILNVMIIRERGQIKVNCLALIVGEHHDFQISLGYVQQFFESLDKSLKN